MTIDAIDQFDIRRKQTFEDFLRQRLMKHYAGEEVQAVIASLTSAAGSDTAAGKAKAKPRHTPMPSVDDALWRMKEAAQQRGVTLSSEPHIATAMASGPT